MKDQIEKLEKRFQKLEHRTTIILLLNRKSQMLLNGQVFKEKKISSKECPRNILVPSHLFLHYFPHCFWFTPTKQRMKKIVLTENVRKPNKVIIQRKLGVLSFVLISILKSNENILFIDFTVHSVSFSKSFLKTLFL